MNGTPIRSRTTASSLPSVAVAQGRRQRLGVLEVDLARGPDDDRAVAAIDVELEPARGRAAHPDPSLASKLIETVSPFSVESKRTSVARAGDQRDPDAEPGALEVRLHADAVVGDLDQQPAAFDPGGDADRSLRRRRESAWMIELETASLTASLTSRAGAPACSASSATASRARLMLVGVRRQLQSERREPLGAGLHGSEYVPIRTFVLTLRRVAIALAAQVRSNTSRKWSSSSRSKQTLLALTPEVKASRNSRLVRYLRHQPRLEQGLAQARLGEAPAPLLDRLDVVEPAADRGDEPEVGLGRAHDLLVAEGQERARELVHHQRQVPGVGVARRLDARPRSGSIMLRPKTIVCR